MIEDKKHRYRMTVILLFVLVTGSFNLLIISSRIVRGLLLCFELVWVIAEFSSLFFSSSLGRFFFTSIPLLASAYSMAAALCFTVTVELCCCDVEILKDYLSSKLIWKWCYWNTLCRNCWSAYHLEVERFSLYKKPLWALNHELLSCAFLSKS